MKLISLKVLNGPNYWSNDIHQLILLKLNIPKKEKISITALKDLQAKFNELCLSTSAKHNSKIKELISKLDSASPVSPSPSSASSLLSSPTSASLVLNIAVLLQALSGVETEFTKISPINNKNFFQVIFSYEVENAGIYAAETACKIVQGLTKEKLYPTLKKDVLELKKIMAFEGLGPSTKSIVEEAKKRNIPYRRLNRGSLGMLGYGNKQKLINATATSDTSIIGVDIAGEKDFTKKILAAAYIPVPEGIIVENLKQLREAIKTLQFPIVVKPLDGNHGRGVTTNINTQAKAYAAFKWAKASSDKILVEHFINGLDYRFLIVNYKFAAAARRQAASIVGDGKSNIQQLIDAVNNDPKRGDQHENVLTKIKIDQISLDILHTQGLNLESILPKGKEIFLKYSANISTGGTATDVTDMVHPDNILLVERVARLSNLNICGIDIVCEDIKQPLTKENGAIIEVNASPGIRMHLSPNQGKARNVAKNIVDALYPEGSPSRIPIVAVTGTNGKTTIVRLIANFAMHTGYQVGFTTTDGIYINEKLIYKGDCSGPRSALSILREPTVDFAVFECARGGILDHGLGFDKCNTSIVTNITADHLGLKDIETLEDLAKVKEVVPKSTFPDGYAMLNADDNLVYEMRNHVSCKTALFSMDANNPRISAHCLKGGIAAYIKQNNIIIQHGDIKKIFADVRDFPLTHQGTSSAMIQNILAAVLAGILNKFDHSHMLNSLKNFYPSPENIPGRMNLFDFGDFKVLIDYAHNVGAFIELKKYLESMSSKRKIGIIGSPGDRRDEDIRNVGYLSAQIFDSIIIKLDKDSRGRDNQEIISLLKEGISKNNTHIKVKVIPDEQAAIENAIENVKNGDFIAYFPDAVFAAVEYLNNLSPMQPKNTKFI